MIDGVPRTTEPQTLLFDADDTLWENNVLFERVLDDYIDWLAHPTLDRVEVRRIVDEVEEANIVAHGYGSHVFLRSLSDAFTRLAERPPAEADRRRLGEFAALFASGQVELVPDVAAVLAELGDRHTLHLVTKGVQDEQQRKIDASGLAGHFAAIDVVPAKIADTYRGLAQTYRLDPAQTWMIGNSPRSDIIAAREAGLNAVFVPNANTWAHEHAELDPADDRILHLATFAELPRHF